MTQTQGGIGLILMQEDLIRPHEIGRNVAFVEVAAEDLMGDGGPVFRGVARLRTRLPLAIRSGGLGIGATLDRTHLSRLAAICDRFRPFLVTEQLAWSSHATVDLSAARPAPLTETTLDRVSEQVESTQLRLGRRVAIETPVNCGGSANDTLSLERFFRRLVERTRCGIVLDLRNAYLWADAQGQDALAHLLGYPLDNVTAIRLPVSGDVGPTCRRDERTSASDIETIWGLYAWIAYVAGPRPTVLNWDGRPPGRDEIDRDAECAETIVRHVAGGRHDALAS